MISKTIGFRGTQHFQTHPFVWDFGEESALLFHYFSDILGSLCRLIFQLWLGNQSVALLLWLDGLPIYPVGKIPSTKSMAYPSPYGVHKHIHWLWKIMWQQYIHLIYTIYCIISLRTYLYIYIYIRANTLIRPHPFYTLPLGWLYMQLGR